jgi:hypothetical protein
MHKPQPNFDHCFVCGRLGKAVNEVHLPDGTIAVEAALTLADFPAELLAGADPEAPGWRGDD